MVPEGLLLEGAEPEHSSELIACRALRERWLWEDDLLGLTAHLPSSTRNFQHPAHGDTWSCSFLTGAYSFTVSALASSTILVVFPGSHH